MHNKNNNRIVFVYTYVYDNDIWKYDEMSRDYLLIDKSGEEYLICEELNLTYALNDEVEVIEDKKIEKVNNYVLCDYDFKNKDDDNNLIATNIIDKAFEEYSHKINEIIDKLNEGE